MIGRYEAFVSIFAVTFGLLVNEILLSSIFQVLIGEGNTVAAISVALLGLSASGVVVYLSPKFQNPERAATLYRSLLFWFSVTLMASTFAIMRFPLNYIDLVFSRGDFEHEIMKRFLYVVAVVPFFMGGLCINVIIRRHSDKISRLYFSDLSGAALGCLASPLLLATVGAPRGIIYAALPAALIGASSISGRGVWRKSLLALPVLLIVIATLEPGLLRFRKLNTMGNVRDPQFRSFLIDEDDIEFEKWALDAWTIIRSPEIPQQWEDFEGWGLSKNYRGPIPRTKLVNYNARFSTYITEYDGNLDKLRDWLDSDLITLHYLVGRNYQDVLNIGAGGGREVLNALNHDVRKITAIDVSTVVINDIMKDRLREFSGGLYFDPRVHALAEEGRSFTERTPDKYDLIDFSIVGGMNLEKMDLVRIDDLFTMEALESYLNHLKDAGVFSYVMYTTRSDIVDEMADRKFLTRVPYIPALRTLAGLRFVFEKKFPDLDFKDHILIAGLHGVVDPRYDLVHIIMSRSPFSNQEQARFLDTCRDLDFVPFYPAKLSGDSSGGLYADIVENSDIALMAQSLPFNILPATDDIPFHYSFGWRHLREAYEQGNLIAFLSRNPIVSMGATMSLLAVLLTLVPLFWFTFRKGSALPDLGNSWSLLLFFAFVGYGYMAVEIATLFKLHLYLGKPIYGLSVGLFSFLFSSGLGSNFTHKFETRELPRRLYGCVAFILVIGFGFFLWSGALFSATMFLPLIARIAVAVLAIFPLAFIMGMFFPMGIKLISGEQQALIPWAWAINGCLSVVGIFGTRAVALFLGFDQSLLIGLLTYSLVAVCILLFSRARPLAKP